MIHPSSTAYEETPVCNRTVGRRRNHLWLQKRNRSCYSGYARCTEHQRSCEVIGNEKLFSRKPSFGSVCFFYGDRYARSMNPRLILLIVALIGLVGCDNASDKNATSGEKPSAATTTPAQKPSTISADMKSLNKAVGSFYVQEGRFPNDLLELVEKKILPRIPALPEKASWDYDTNTGVVQIQKN